MGANLGIWYPQGKMAKSVKITGRLLTMKEVAEDLRIGPARIRSVLKLLRPSASATISPKKRSVSISTAKLGTAKSRAEA